MKPVASQSLWTTWLPLAGFVCLALLLTRPLWDMDLWWHLATGRQILQDGTWLAADPFAYPGLEQPDAERFFLLNAYWAGQVLMYVCQMFLGAPGLILLRIALLLGGPIAIFCWLKKRDAAVPGLGLLLLTGLLTHYFTGVRPALFSYFCFALMLLLLSGAGFCRSGKLPFRHHPGPAFALMPLMLVWANLHPGFMLGALALLIYLAGESVQIWRGGDQVDRRAFALVGLSVSAAVLLTLINPNGPRPYLALLQFEGSALQGRTSEYVSPLALLLQGQPGAWPYWLLLTIALGLALWRPRLIGWTRLALLLLLAVVSLQAQRYLLFFGFGAVILVLPTLREAGRSRWLGPGLQSVAVLGIVGLLLSLAQARNDGWGQTLSTAVKPASIPQAAMQFVSDQRPQGQLMTHFNWGGYQAWALQKSYPVLIDGRSLNARVFEDYTHLLWTDQAMAPLWEKYGVQTLVVPRLKPFNGELYRLTTRLARDPQWTLVHRDPVAMVLVRGEPNQRLAERFRIGKRAIWEDVLTEARRNLETGLPPLYAYQAQFEAYRQLGRFTEAQQVRGQLEEVVRSLQAQKVKAP